MRSTIQSINAGSCIPDSIYVCITEGFEFQENVDDHANVEIVRTAVRGQVGQRAVGLGLADSDFVVQLDDDIILEHDCLERLIEAGKRLGPDCALSPAFVKPGSKESLYKIDNTTWTRKLYFRLLNGKQGYRQGTVTRAGTTFGVDIADSDCREIETEWLPGGCVLHIRNNIIAENYFPFPGKAYSEDLYFSELAKKKGLRLYIIRDSRCYVEPMPELSRQGIGEFLRGLAGDMAARRQYVTNTGRSRLRMHCFYLIYILRFLVNKVRNV